MVVGEAGLDAAAVLPTDWGMLCGVDTGVEAPYAAGVVWAGEVLATAEGVLSGVVTAVVTGVVTGVVVGACVVVVVVIVDGWQRGKVLYCAIVQAHSAMP